MLKFKYSCLTHNVRLLKAPSDFEAAKIVAERLFKAECKLAWKTYDSDSFYFQEDLGNGYFIFGYKRRKKKPEQITVGVKRRQLSLI